MDCVKRASPDLPYLLSRPVRFVRESGEDLVEVPGGAAAFDAQGFEVDRNLERDKNHRDPPDKWQLHEIEHGMIAPGEYET